MKLKLQKITTSTTQNIFHISVKKSNTAPVHIAFLSDTEEKDTFEPLTKLNQLRYNKNSIYDSNNVIYNNMYISTSPRYRSSFYNKPSTLRTGMTYDFLNVVNHNLLSNIIKSVLVLNYIYMLEPCSEYGHFTSRNDIIAWLSSDNGRTTIPAEKIKTVIYNKDKLEENLKDGKLEDTSISVKLQNVKYNMIYEMPGSIYNDYESGNIIAHTFKGKNLYDCEYSMTHEDKMLSYIRNYTDIDNCNLLLYLKYENKDFINSENEELHHPVVANKYNIQLPNIEIILLINREKNSLMHNTELYSIDIDVKQMFNEMQLPKTKSNVDLDKVKENTKHEIQNCVRAIAETILPANVLLFHIYVNGE